MLPKFKLSPNYAKLASEYLNFTIVCYRFLFGDNIIGSSSQAPLFVLSSPQTSSKRKLYTKINYTFLCAGTAYVSLKN
jgi:hypothetical protein